MINDEMKKTPDNLINSTTEQIKLTSIIKQVELIKEIHIYLIEHNINEPRLLEILAARFIKCKEEFKKLDN